MKRSALPFLAASIADRSASAVLPLRRDKSSSSLVIYRKAVYQTDPVHERLVGACAAEALSAKARSEPDTRFASRDVFITVRSKSCLKSPVHALLYCRA